MKVIKVLVFLWLISISCFGQGEWVRKNDFPGLGKKRAMSFVIGDLAYFGLGEESNKALMQSVWSYNKTNDSWTQISDFGGAGRGAAVAFVIDKKAYVGTGFDFKLPGTVFNDFWEYDPDSNNWIKKADFPGGDLWDGVGFSVSGKGYVGIGTFASCVCNHLWEYDPVSDNWTQKNDFPGTNRLGAAAFTIKNKAYVGFGKTPSGIHFNNLNDLWEYDPFADSWTQKTGNNFINGPNPVAIGNNNRGYVFSGNQMFIYLSEKDQWVSGDALSQVYDGASLFFLDKQLYLISGFLKNDYSKEVWQLDPSFTLLPKLTLFATTMVSTSQIELSWSDEQEVEEKYEIYRSTTSGSGFVKIAEVEKNITSYVDAGLTTDVTYYYKVKAVNATEGFESAFSNEVSATISLNVGISLRAFSQSLSEVRLAWSSDNNKIDGYKIERSEDETKGYGEIAEILMVSASGYIDQNLESGKTYFYRIRAFKGASFSQYSNRIGANTLVTSVPNRLSQQIKVLNNPNTTGIFQIKTEGLNRQKWQVTLRDGQMKALLRSLVTKNNTGYKIDLHQKTSGVYFLIFDTPKGKAIKKLWRH